MVELFNFEKKREARAKSNPKLGEISVTCIVSFIHGHALSLAHSQFLELLYYYRSHHILYCYLHHSPSQLFNYTLNPFFNFYFY